MILSLELSRSRLGGRGVGKALPSRAGLEWVGSKAARIRAAVPSPFRVLIPPTSPPRRGSGDLWGDCGTGGAARAAIGSPACRSRPASQRKRRLKRRARDVSGASIESERHPSAAQAALQAPAARRSTFRSGSQALAGRVRRACCWGLAVRPRGGHPLPLMSRCCERRTGGGPKARSAGRSAATRKEDGPEGPRPAA